MKIALRGGDEPSVLALLDALAPEEQQVPDFVALRIEALLRTRPVRGGRDAARAQLELRKDDATLRCRLGELLFHTGRTSKGLVELQTASAARGDDVATLTASARALMRLGGRQNVEDTSARLVAAIRAGPDEWLPRTLYGLLRYEVYGEWSGASSGEQALLDVLERNGEIEEALVALYRIRAQNHLLDPQKTESFLDRALAANPRSVPALVARGIGWLDDRRFEDGVRSLDAALAVDPNHRGTLAQRAAAAFVSGDHDAAVEFRARALTFEPAWGGVDLAIGDRLVGRCTRFADAVPHYQAALAANAEDVEALHGQGKALIYSGRGEEARELLVRARELRKGFVHPWRNNMIAVQDLLDEEYERVDDGGFRFLLHKSDAEVLKRYLLPFAREAKQTLDAKSQAGFPEGPVRFGTPHLGKLSVRTVGFRGFTALGACFGPLITFVSPVDRDLRRNDFMWTATVWHKYTARADARTQPQSRAAVVNQGLLGLRGEPT